MFKLLKVVVKDLDDIFSFLNNDKLFNFFFIGDI